jgi:hypothetical protein
MLGRDARSSSGRSTCRTARSIRVLALLATFSASLSAAPPESPSGFVAPPAEERREPARYAVGIRVSAAGMIGGLNAFLLGLDVSYSPRPWFAFGLETELARVDNGADPGYCTGCMDGGSSWRAFGEIRPFDDYPVFPFARGSAGLYDIDIIGPPRLRAQVGPALGAATGVEGRLRPLYLRVIAFATAQLGTDTPVRRSNHFAGLALEVGAVF